jgi:hypothetical protein
MTTVKIVSTLFSTLAILAGVLLWVYQVYGPIPPNWVPWKQPQLDFKPAWFGHVHINRLHRNGAMCVTALNAATKLQYTPQQNRKNGDCGFSNVVRVEQSHTDYNIDPIATCGIAAALYWWEQDLQRLATDIFQSRLTQIDQLGTFACRNVNSASVGRRSQHATANAIDIQAFVFANGKRVDVLKHWNTTGPEARYLREARRAACRVFNGVLSPDYNALHANHFHLDLGPYLICR